MDIIRLDPVFKQMIWGGNRMRSEYGYDIPGDDTGECWAISAHPNGDGIVRGGEYDGMKLSRLWADHRELFGGYDSDRFPLLTKIIDAKADLSVQVHPDDEYAKTHENGSFGKMECWYILDCDPGATIIVGHNATTKEELDKMVHEGRWKELLREIPIKKGDFFQIAPGTIHAIKGGTLILESQQNSDITYRLYDYDRLQNGKPRELHIEKSLDVINVPYEQADSNVSGLKTANTWFKGLQHCERYSVWYAALDGEETLTQDQSFLLGSVIEGVCELKGDTLKKGDHFIVPSGFGNGSVKGKAEFIFSAPV